MEEEKKLRGFSGNYHLNGYPRGHAVFYCVCCKKREEEERVNPPETASGISFRKKEKSKPFVAKKNTQFGPRPEEGTHERTMWCAECRKITRHVYSDGESVYTKSHA
jgi:hypothetical protein